MSNRIKLVHIINGLGLGGGERFLADLVAHLDTTCFEQRVLCLYKAGPFSQPIEAAGIPVDVLGLGRHMRLNGWIQVWQTLRKQPIDIVHTHLTEACWYGLPAAWLANVPVRVAHLQNCHWQFPLKLRILDRTTSIFANAAIACSEAVRDFYLTEFHYPAPKLHVVYNSVAFSRFENSPNRATARCMLNLPTDVPILVTVASLTDQKGHQYLLEAMSNVLELCPQTLLLLVGDGHLRKTLEQFSLQRGLGESVRFLGKRTDVPLILAAADFFVLPSLWEGLPLVLAEAGAARLPVVATKIGGIDEIVEDGVTGILVPSRQPEPLAEAIIDLLLSEQKRQQMGESAYQRVSSVFNIQHAALAVEKIYFSLLERK